MIELNKIYCETNLATMRRMPDNFVDLTVTSPPYDDIDENFNPISKHGQRTYNGYEWDFKSIAQELFRVTKQGGVVVWVVNDPTINGSESLASNYQKIYFRRVGFNIHDTMIYEIAGTGAKGSILAYWQSFEYSFVLSKGQPKSINLIADIKNIRAGAICTKGRIAKNGFEKDTRRRLVPLGSVRSNVWRLHAGNNGDDETDHPAPFPEALARDHIYSWSNENDLIYDPFMGSGTVAKMAHLMKRNWIGSEINQAYVDKANKRLEKYLNQADLFEMPKMNGKRQAETTIAMF